MARTESAPAGGRAVARPGPLLVRAPRPEVRVPRWDEQARAVLEHDRGPLRVVGGPGTGKTALLLEAVAKRVREGMDPERMLLLVGSRRAAVELRERLTGLLHGGLPDPAALDARTSRELLARTVHSYAFGVLRLHAARNDDPPPRLLAGAEQDAVVRDLLGGELANWNGSVPDSGWPERLRPAIGLPAFANELRELLLRAAERGLGPEELFTLGERHEMPEWVAAGRFFRTYEHVILLRGAAGRGAPQATAPALDSAELVSAALDALASDPELFAAESRRVRHLFVDDAQDLDPQQMELVRVLARTAQSTLLAGDPDQAVLNFRGADPGGLRAVEAPTAVLTVDHRQAPAVRAASARLARSLAGSGEGRVRVPPPVDPGAPEPDPGSVLVRVFSSPAAEAGWIADRLRRAHLVEGVPWSDMAVLSRSARRTLPALRRALVAAGVPIAAPPDELPLARQPAVLPLLLILRCATRPDEIDADVATALLTSSLGSGDPMRMRRLRRGLLKLHAAARTARRAAEPPLDPDPGSGTDIPGTSRSQDRDHGREPVGERPASAADDPVPDDAERAGSDPLLVDALRSAAAGRPDPLTALPPGDSAPLRAVSRLLATAAGAIREGQSVEEVLWRVWRQSGLAKRWGEASSRGGPVGAHADRDLDAVLALFDAAARYTDRLPGADVEGFTSYLTDQQLPGDTLADRAPRGESVALLTAHAARGREWEVVAVPSVQEGSWPDLRLRGSLLGNERLVDLVAGVAEPAGANGRVSRVAPLLAEERRLFYVACSRARSRLLVSAVQGEDEQPSRFLDELDPVPASALEGRTVHRPGRALVLAELVGELRRAVTAPDHGDPEAAASRARAAAQLARLAAENVPGAHPDEWYGVAPPSSDAPLRAPGALVPISPSDIELINSCPLRWVLQRHGGDETGALSAVTGSLVHALVQAGAAGADPAELEAALRTAWDRLDAGAPWYGRRELARVREMLAGFDRWLAESRAEGLRLVAVEQAVQLDIAAEPDVAGDDPGNDGAGTEEEPPTRRSVRLRGRVDRLEVDAEGRPVVVDVKTGKTAVSAKTAAEHPQLAVYQLATALGAFSDLVGEAPPGGARLVYVADRYASGRPKEPMQEPLDSETAAEWRDVVWRCAEETSGTAFVARVGPDCERCPVRTSCPAVSSGRSVVSS
jgi:superfamily I DNA/RNA helicase/RecB family exonuclease